MSFQDIETGLAQTNPLRQPLQQLQHSQEDGAFTRLQSSLSIQVFKINANVQGILKLVDQLGTARDSHKVRKELHDLMETTRDMVKRGTEGLKQLSTLQSKLPHQKTALQKTSHDFQLSLVAFQRAQQVGAERQKIVVQGVKLAVEDEHRSQDPESLSTSPTAAAVQRHTQLEQRQAQIFQQQLSPEELAYQESLIHERETEIREIETGIHELAEIFQDLGALVSQQGTMLDDISGNIERVAVDASNGASELVVASDYQRKAGRRAACLSLILAVVAAVVLLAILS